MEGFRETCCSRSGRSSCPPLSEEIVVRSEMGEPLFYPSPDIGWLALSGIGDRGFRLVLPDGILSTWAPTEKPIFMALQLVGDDPKWLLALTAQPSPKRSLG